LKIVQYPHPTLRHQSKPVQQVDRALRAMVDEMFELMYAANGVGLAANQVDLPFRLFVMNLAASPDEGEEHVLINPVISRPRGNEEKEEGCLSIPGICGLVIRPAKVHLNAFTLSGDEIDEDITGMMSRVVQHEADHLDGVLFIDRLSAAAKMELEPSLEQFLIEYDTHRERPTEEQISQRLHQLERQYC
jgi:peptide deformylase